MPANLFTEKALYFWWLAIRPKTLLAAIGPVLLANALAAQQTGIKPVVFVLTLSCAILLQVAVNLANDLFDALSGVDDVQRRGPQRMVQSGKISAKAMRKALFLVMLSAMVCGLPLVYLGGWLFLLLGILSLLAALAYSAGPYPLASHGLGEVTVFIFFGLIAVMGSYYLQTQRFDGFVLPFASVCGLFSAAMMLVNNIRDRETDIRAGKYTLATKLGHNKSRQLYVLLLLLVGGVQLLVNLKMSVVQFLPLCFLLLVIPCLSIKCFHYQYGQLNKLLQMTGMSGFGYCLLVCVAVGI